MAFIAVIKPIELIGGVLFFVMLFVSVMMMSYYDVKIKEEKERIGVRKEEKRKLEESEVITNSKNKSDNFFRDKILAPIIVGLVVGVGVGSIGYMFTGEFTPLTKGAAFIGSIITVVIGGKNN